MTKLEALEQKLQIAIMKANLSIKHTAMLEQLVSQFITESEALAEEVTDLYTFWKEQQNVKTSDTDGQEPK